MGASLNGLLTAGKICSEGWRANLMVSELLLHFTQTITALLKG